MNILIFYCILFFSTSLLKSMVNENKNGTWLTFPLQYLDNNLKFITDSKESQNLLQYISNSESCVAGDFIYRDNEDNDKKELRGVFLNSKHSISFIDQPSISFIGQPCSFNKNDTFVTWGKRTNNIFFLHSYNNEQMFDYILYLSNRQQMQVFSVETKNLYRKITTQHSIKIHDSYIGLEKSPENCSSDRYRWRESFVFTINFLNRSYHFRYRVKDGTIILFHDGTKKLDLKDSKYFSGTTGRFFYFGSKDYIVDTSNDRVFYLIKNENKEVIGTVFMGFLSKNFQAMLDVVNSSSNNEKRVDSCIQFLEGCSTWIRLKIICMTYFFRIKYQLNLLFKKILLNGIFT